VAALALTVDPVVEPEHSEGVLVNRPRQVSREQGLELVDIGGQLRVDLQRFHDPS
jgi:hypothetical protein